MFKQDDVIMHSKSGVCKVLSIKKNVNENDPRAKYYELEPIYTKGTTILTPVDNDRIFLRYLYAKEELESMISQLSAIEGGEWEDDQKLRKNISEKAINSGDLEQLLELVATLYIKHKERKEAGKQLNIADQQNLKYATNLIHEEFAYVFDIKIEEVEVFIDHLLNPEKDTDVVEEEAPKKPVKKKPAAKKAKEA
ncbi:MAG: hypothetical protein GX775_03995 [Erysipelothrix sp.]|nr:hypothetical protein [Erysipelothrix sp.]